MLDYYIHYTPFRMCMHTSVYVSLCVCMHVYSLKVSDFILHHTTAQLQGCYRGAIVSRCMPHACVVHIVLLAGEYLHIDARSE